MSNTACIIKNVASSHALAMSNICCSSFTHPSHAPLEKDTNARSTLGTRVLVFMHLFFCHLRPLSNWIMGFFCFQCVQNWLHQVLILTDFYFDALDSYIFCKFSSLKICFLYTFQNFLYYGKSIISAMTLMSSAFHLCAVRSPTGICNAAPYKV